MVYLNFIMMFIKKLVYNYFYFIFRQNKNNYRDNIYNYDK